VTQLSWRFPVAVENIIAASEAQCREGVKGSFDPIGIAHEKHQSQFQLTPQAILALY
jgi:hypothetical protein